MTNILDSPSAADEKRLREILDRTRIGLREDLDDLRGELVDDLDNFESRLQKMARELPPWLDVPGQSLRAPFQLAQPARLDGTLLGPRTVAVVAGDLETFLVEWLGDEDEIPAWSRRGDDDAVDRFHDDLQSLRKLTAEVVDAVEQRADDGTLQLEQILESIVFELQSRRETDVEALESLIQDGDVAPGRNARAEIAELWEEQRQRVDRLQTIWDDLLNLHHEGITRTLSGLDELQQLLDRAVDGIQGAGLGGGRLSQLPEPEVEANQKTNTSDSRSLQSEAEANEKTNKSDSQNNLSPKPPSSSPSSDSPPKPSRDGASSKTNRFVRSTEDEEPEDKDRDSQQHENTDDPQSDDEVATDGDGDSTDGLKAGPMTTTEATSQADIQSDESDDDDNTEPGQTQPITGISDDSDDRLKPVPPPDEASGNDATEPKTGQTVDLFENSEQSDTIPDSNRAAETAPISTSDPENNTDENKDDENKNHDTADIKPRETTDKSSPVPVESQPEIDSGQEVESQPEIDSGQEVESQSETESEPEIEVEEVEESGTGGNTERAQRQDQLRVRTFRIRDGWQTISADEIAATLGPPALFVGALLALCLLSFADLAPNPMTTWEWALPASFGAMALLVILPLLTSWRPMWDDTDFTIIRRGPVEEEVDLRITADDELSLDRTSWAIDELDAPQLRRWDSPQDQARGWLLTIEPPYHTPIHLMSIAVDNTAWQQSDVSETTPPEDAWQLPPEEFDSIRRLLGIK